MSAHVLLNFIEFYCVCFMFHSTFFHSCWDMFCYYYVERGLCVMLNDTAQCIR